MYHHQSSFPRLTRRRRRTYLCGVPSIMPHPALLVLASVEFVGSRSTARRQALLILGHVVGIMSAARKHHNVLGLRSHGLGQNQNQPRNGGKYLHLSQRWHQGGQQQRNREDLCAGWKGLNLLSLEDRRQSLDNFLLWSPSSANMAGTTLETFAGASS